MRLDKNEVRKVLSPVILQFFLLALSTFITSSNALAKSLPVDKIPQRIIKVSNQQQLYSAIRRANELGNTAIELADGNYLANQTIIIKNHHVTLRSKSGDPSKVSISGLGMRKTNGVDNLVRVSGRYFTLEGITLQQSGNHLLQIAGEQDADFPILRNCVLKDSYEQLFKVSYNRKSKISSDNGLIQNCEFSYTAGIGPQYYIGGIDVHGGKNWIVRGNVFKGIASPGNRVAEHAIHFWNNTANTLIENNIIINSDRGIGLGMKNRPTFGGIIQNNIILHNALQHPNADVGIILEESPNTQVLNNKIFLAHNYPNAIEYRFSNTINIQITGNLTNKAIRKRDGAIAQLNKNNRSKNIADYLSKQQLEQLSFKHN
jgi:hypothetical protein